MNHLPIGQEKREKGKAKKMVARLTRHRFRKRSRITLESLATKEPTHALGHETRGALFAFREGKLLKGFNLKDLLEGGRQRPPPD
jgi:hypothetical protein